MSKFTPEVGTGATLCYPQDRLPYRVVKVSPTGSVITLQRVANVDTSTGHKPSHYVNGFPVWAHTYSPEELESLAVEGIPNVKAHRTSNGSYRCDGTPVFVGEARYWRDYSL